MRYWPLEICFKNHLQTLNLKKTCHKQAHLKTGLEERKTWIEKPTEEKKKRVGVEHTEETKGDGVLWKRCGRWEEIHLCSVCSSLKSCINSEGSCVYQGELPLLRPHSVSPLQQTVTDHIRECLLPFISHYKLCPDWILCNLQTGSGQMVRRWGSL